MAAPTLEIRSDYWDDPVAKAAFRDLAREIFGLDFAAWDEAGYWDNLYRPFSFFDTAGRVAASVCLYTMDMVVDGRRTRLGQISGVATRPEYRRRGLARTLIEAAVRWARSTGHAGFFLFADDEARPLYAQAGFRPLVETVTVLHPAPLPPRAGARRLDLAHAADRNLLHELALRRAPVSRRLGVFNDRLLMFHALGPFAHDTWHLPELGVAVLARRRGTQLTVADIVGPHLPPLARILPHFCDDPPAEVVLRFEPDQLGDLAALGSVEHRPLPENGLHLRDTTLVAPPFVLPFTAQA